MNKFTILKNHPINAAAEYCFGRLCKEHYEEIKKTHHGMYDFEYYERLFNRAIAHGLTHEISTGDNAKLLNEIWDKVKKEEAVNQLVDWVIDFEETDFIENPSKTHPYYLACLIKFGEERANEILEYAMDDL